MEARNAKMSLREERWALRNEDGAPESRTARRLTKMEARETKMAPREERWTPKLQDGRPGRKMAAREAKKPAVPLKNGPSKQDSRPDGENKGRDEKNGGIQLRSRLGKQREPFPIPVGAYTPPMRSVADDLRDELREEVLRLPFEEHMALALRLGERGLEMFRQANGLDRETAIRELQRQRQSGRTPSKCMSELIG